MHAGWDLDSEKYASLWGYCNQIVDVWGVDMRWCFSSIIIILVLLFSSPSSLKIEDYVPQVGGSSEDISKGSRLVFGAPTQPLISDAESYDKNIVFVRTIYEIAPSNIEIMDGFLCWGEAADLLRNDGAGIFLRSVLKDIYILDAVFVFDVGGCGTLSMSLTATANITLKVYWYNETSSSFDVVVSFTNIDSLNRNITVCGGSENLTIRILATSSEVFNMTLGALCFYPAPLVVPISISFLTRHRLLYRLVFQSLPSCLKIYLKNMTYLVSLNYTSRPIVYNYSENSIRVCGGGELILVFMGYDYWRYDQNVSIEIVPECAGVIVDADDINITYRYQRLSYAPQNTSDYYFERTITLCNPSGFDLYNISIPIVLNDSWFNMIPLARNLTLKVVDSKTGKSLPMYVSRWDGRSAVVCIKMEHFAAGERRNITLLYGNPNLPPPTNDDFAAKQGPILKMSDLASRGFWYTENGSIFSTYYAASNNSVVGINAFSNNGTLLFRCNLSGYLNIFYIEESASSDVVSEDWVITSYIVYVDRRHYYAIMVRNDTDTSPILKLVAVSDNESIVIGEISLSGVNNPLQYYVRVSTYPLEGIIVCRVAFNEFSRTISFDDVFGLLGQGWRLGFSMRGLKRREIVFDEWCQSFEHMPHICDYGKELLHWDIAESTLSGTDWLHTTTTTLYVPIKSKVFIEISDLLGDVLASIECEPPCDVVSVELPAAILEINSERPKATTIVVVSEDFKSMSIHVDGYGSQDIVLSPGIYALYAYSADHMFLGEMIVSATEGRVLSLRIDDELGILAARNLSAISTWYAFTEVDRRGSFSDVGIDIILVNYTGISLYLGDSINRMFIDVADRWISAREDLLDSFGRLNETLSALGIVCDFVPTEILMEDKADYVSIVANDQHGLSREYMFNGTLEDVIDRIRRSKVNPLYEASWFFSRMVGGADIREVFVDSFCSTIVFEADICGDVELVLDVNSSLAIVKYSGLAMPIIRTLIDSVLCVLPLINTTTVTRAFDGANYWEVGLHLEDRSLLAECYSVHGLEVWMSENLSRISLVGLPLVEYWYDQQRLVVENTQTISVANITLRVAVQPKFSGILIDSVCGNFGDIDRWLTEIATSRRVLVYDKYSGNILSNVRVLVNNSEVSVGERFLSLRGIMSLEIVDLLWNISVFSDQMCEEDVIVGIGYGELIVVNNMSSSICLFVRATESNVTSNYTVGPSSQRGVLLVENHSYDVTIYGEGGVITNTTVCLVAPTPYERPRRIIIVLSGSSEGSPPSNQSTSEPSNQTNTNTSTPSNTSESFNQTISATKELKDKIISYVRGVTKYATHPILLVLLPATIISIVAIRRLKSS